MSCTEDKAPSETHKPRCTAIYTSRVSFRKLDKGGQNHSYEKNGGEGVRATARLLGGSGGMLPQKIFEFYTL